MQRWTHALLALAVVVPVACSSGDASEPAGATTINIDGSSTVFPVSQLAAEEFAATADVDVAVGQSGTGGGFAKFCAGETQISDASRPIAEDEAAVCEAAGVEFVQFLVGLDGISNVVPAGTDFVSCLTTDQLAQVWQQGSQMDSWSDVDPSLPDEPLELYGPGPDSGTFDFFVEEILGEDTRPRTDYVASEDDNVLVQGIAGSSSGLGYFGYAYYVENAELLNVVALDAGDGCVEPSVDTIADGTYALSRPLFIYVREDALQQSVTTEFVRFYLREAARLAEQVGYVAAPAADLEANLATLEEVVS